jgi:predicted metal-dependent peptidase
MAMKLTAQQKIDRANVWIMRQPQFIGYSGVIMVGESRIESDPKKCPTAYTDGYNVVYGEKFINDLTEEEVRFISLHENLHKMYRHTITWRHLFQQSPILTNIAADYVVNGVIMQAGCAEVHMPKGCLFDKDLSDGTKDVGEVFRLLAKKYPHLNQPNCFAPGQGDGLGDTLDEHDWGAGDQWSPEEIQEMTEKIDSAIRQGQILAGKVAGDQARDFGELLRVKTDWRQVMQQFFQSSCAGDGELSYRRPNRRFLHMDEIFPTEICETLPHVVIGIDTSGSIGGEILTNFMSNVATMLRQVNPEKIDLLYWDTRVAGHERYEQGEVDKLLASTKPAGGGGTSPACVSNWIEKEGIKPTCLVMLTDGYVDGWPKEVCPTIWCIYENPSANPPYGTVAHL